MSRSGDGRASRPRSRLLATVAVSYLAACSLGLGLSTPVAVAAVGDLDLQAHRGGRGEATEESLGAFAKALEIGVSTLELDVVLSADGQPMVWHDPRIEAEKCVDTAPAFADDPLYPYVGQLVHQLSRAQLGTLVCAKKLADFPQAQVMSGNRIATLPQVFALADAYRATVRYNIETKVEADQPDDSAPPQEFVDVILREIRRAGRLDRVDIQSFDWRTLPMVHAAEPDLPLVALYDETTWVPGSRWLNGLDPAIVTDPPTAARLVGATAVSPHYPLIDRGYVDHAHALGLKVIPWTVNEQQAMQQMIDDGVDGVITDYPSRLRAVMADLGLALPPAFRRH